MTTEELNFRIPGHPEFWPLAKEVVTTNTTLLDTFKVNANGEVVIYGWSPKVFDFFWKLLHYEDDKLDEFLNEFEAKVEDIWSIASFYEKFIKPAQTTDDSEMNEPRRPTLRLRQWFSRWWEKNGGGFRGAFASELSVLVMPAFYIGDARTFMSVTHDWFLHTNSKQTLRRHARMPDDSDEGGKGVIKNTHPLLDKLEAVRSNMINKIEDALPYDEERDGLPRGRGSKGTKCEDTSWCPKLKSAAYYRALAATGCWPVRKAMEDYSIHDFLTALAKRFEYVNYDKLRGVPDRDLARAKIPGGQGAATKKRCTVCVDAAVKAAFDRKVKTLVHTLLDDKKTWVTVKRNGQPVRVEVDDSFAGLCLDCPTKSKFGCDDVDYWNHCMEFQYDHGCTVRHGQPTWYFSFMGRPGDMKQFQKKLREETGCRPLMAGRS